MNIDVDGSTKPKQQVLLMNLDMGIEPVKALPREATIDEDEC